MIGLLARRTLSDRPRRTLLLLFGFGISVGVMITLLSIGQAVLDQARDKDVVGGGDIVLLPEGVDVEVMKVGGATGMFFAIDNARFVYRQVLSGPRFAASLAEVPAPDWGGATPVTTTTATAPPLAAASPSLAGKLVYLRRAGDPAPPHKALAHGVLPSLERAVNGGPLDAGGRPLDWSDTHTDRMWMDPPVDSLYNAMDRFHLPPAGRRDLDRWAEWLYYNFTDPATGTYGFLSFIVAGDLAAGRGHALPLLQLVRPGAAPVRFQGDLPLAPSDLSTSSCDLRFGAATRARFASGAWHLQLGWASAAGDVRGELTVHPTLDLYYPPFLIHASDALVSGYAVPALHARLDGWIEAGGRRLDLENAPAYHDHNWGTWTSVRWDWGTASSPTHGLFYGRVEHPELRKGIRNAGVFAMLMQARQPDRRGGFLALFRPDSIAYEWQAPPGDLPGHPNRVPATLAMRAASQDGDRLEVRARVETVLSTPPRASEPALVFLQMRGPFTVQAAIDDREMGFEALGFAETFVASRDSLAGAPARVR